jgi:hypothetical protein
MVLPGYLRYKSLNGSKLLVRKILKGKLYFAPLPRGRFHRKKRDEYMNRMRFSLCVGLLTVLFAGLSLQAANKHYPSNQEPLLEARFVELPLTAVMPRGWLKDQLRVQANGLTGHLDEFWPSLKNSAWKGGDGESWERGPYYLDGLVPLAYLLEDEELIAKANNWMEHILKSPQPNGWFGPEENEDRWPLAVGLKVVTQYYEATGDERALELIKNYFDYLHRENPNWPHNEWRGVRAMENAVTAFWLYRRTGDEKLLEVVDSIFEKSFTWSHYFNLFPFKSKTIGWVAYYDQEKHPKIDKYEFGHPTHVVNIAMGTKYPGIYYQRSRNEKHKDASLEGIKKLDQYHGQVTGRFTGDEHLAGKRPTQGTEHCAVVEYMFSLEKLMAFYGDVKLADRLESLAYNANPGTWTADCWAHQYDQQANQVLVSIARREWTSNDDTSNLYGLEPNFGCCTANMHQGWPKFVSHMWMATNDEGLAAIAYGPNVVTAKVGDGSEVTITQKTNYPFEGEIEFVVDTDQPVEFPLYLRIPSWADEAKITSPSERTSADAGTFEVIERTWKSGDKVSLSLPMKVRGETRYNNSIALLRGPLYYSLKIGEKWNKLNKHSDEFPSWDWEIVPTTPWNYGLLIDRENPEKSVDVEIREPAKQPFEKKKAPVTLKVKGQQIPGWTFFRNSAGDPPKSPVKVDTEVTELELVPYGSTRLRITEFPVVAQ